MSTQYYKPYTVTYRTAERKETYFCALLATQSVTRGKNLNSAQSNSKTGLLSNALEIPKPQGKEIIIESCKLCIYSFF